VVARVLEFWGTQARRLRARAVSWNFNETWGRSKLLKTRHMHLSSSVPVGYRFRALEQICGSETSRNVRYGGERVRADHRAKHTARIICNFACACAPIIRVEKTWSVWELDRARWDARARGPGRARERIWSRGRARREESNTPRTS
jgi:hypothetical protein